MSILLPVFGIYFTLSIYYSYTLRWYLYQAVGVVDTGVEE